MEYLNAFLCGGLLCAVGQIILDKTSLTPGPYSDGLCGGRCAAAGCGCVSVYRGLGRRRGYRAADGLWLLPGEGRGQSRWRRTACWVCSPAD